MPLASFILTGKWSCYNPVMVSAHMQTAGWSEPWVGWSLMGSWGHNGTQLCFGSYVFRSCLWQLPAGGSCRSRGFQPSHVQRLGRTWQNGAGKRRFSFSVAWITGWSSPILYPVHGVRCLWSPVLNLAVLWVGEVFLVEITAGSFGVIIQV